jgi:hypothetical protein
VPEAEPSEQELEIAIKATAELIKEEERKCKKQNYELDLQLVNARSEVTIEETKAKEKE